MDSVSGAASSARPRAMVLRERPVAWVTAAIPPDPSALASVAAQYRRSRSLMSGCRASNFSLSVSIMTGSAMIPMHHISMESSSYFCAAS